MTLVNDYFIVWPSSVTLTFNLPEKNVLNEQLCHNILNSCMNVEVKARPSSIYEHFIGWPSYVTLTFNLPELMFANDVVAVVLLFLRPQ